MENVETLNLIKWPINDVIELDIEIKINDDLNLVFSRNKLTIKSLPHEFLKTAYRWVNWNGFVQFACSNDEKKQARIKRLIRESEGIWEGLLSRLDKKQEA